MAFVAVDKDGSEFIYSEHPYRNGIMWSCLEDIVSLPSGTIKKLIGRDLDWDDEPVELT